MSVPLKRLIRGFCILPPFAIYEGGDFPFFKTGSGSLKGFDGTERGSYKETRLTYLAAARCFLS